MTGKSEEDGLEEIKRLLRSLDQTTAADASDTTKVKPAALKPVPKPSGSPMPGSLPPSLMPSPKSQGLSSLTLGTPAPPPPPPVARGPSATDGPAARWPIAAVGLAVLALAGAGIWWSQLGTKLIAASQPVAADGADRTSSSPPPSPSVVAAASSSVLANRDDPVPTAPSRAAEPMRPRDATADAAPAVAPPPAALPAPPRDLRLRVPARLSILPGQSAPLAIEIDPAAQLTVPAVVTVAGLPDGLSLSKGARAPGADWSFLASEAGVLTVSVPASAAPGRHSLAIELRALDGRVLASVRTALEIAQLQPPPPPMPAPAAAAPPGAAPAPPPATVAQIAPPQSVSPTPMADPDRPPEATTTEWLAESRKLLAAGQVASARLLLQRAADSGLAEAARLLGDTYDPAKLYALGVRGMSGDIAKAIYWYERADELGDPQAKARLLGLGTR